MGFELRGNARYARALDVTLIAGGHEHRARTRDLSLGGLFAETPLDLPVGAGVEVAFRVGTLPEEVRVPATVRWVQRDGGAGVGLRFAGLGRVQQWGLNKFFADGLAVTASS